MDKDLRVKISAQDRLYLESRAAAERLNLSAYVRHELLKNVKLNK